MKLKNKKLAYLFFNAAYAPRGYFLDNPPQDSITSVNVNVIGVVNLAHLFGTILRQRQNGGGIILMSSIIGIYGVAGLSTYCATKIFIAHFSQGLWLEYQKYKIDVLCPLLSSTRTPGYLRSKKQDKQDKMEQNPNEVVSEVLSVLPHTASHGPWIVTGKLNKVIYRFLKFLPDITAIKVLSYAVQKQMPGAAAKST